MYAKQILCVFEIKLLRPRGCGHAQATFFVCVVDATVPGCTCSIIDAHQM